MNRDVDVDGVLAWEWKQLLQQIRAARSASFAYGWRAMARKHGFLEASHQARDDSEERPWRAHIQEAIDELDRRLTGPERDGAKTSSSDAPVIATEFEVLAPRKILRGFAVAVREIPVPLRVPETVLAFISIAGDADMLDRHLDHGIHYHYALADGTHTTTMICWDSRWQASDKSKPNITRPIFNELHGKGAKSKKGTS